MVVAVVAGGSGGGGGGSGGGGGNDGRWRWRWWWWWQRRRWRAERRGGGGGGGGGMRACDQRVGCGLWRSESGQGRTRDRVDCAVVSDKPDADGAICKQSRSRVVCKRFDHGADVIVWAFPASLRHQVRNLRVVVELRAARMARGRARGRGFGVERSRVPMDSSCQCHIITITGMLDCM